MGHQSDQERSDEIASVADARKGVRYESSMDRHEDFRTWVDAALARTFWRTAMYWVGTWRNAGFQLSVDGDNQIFVDGSERFEQQFPGARPLIAKLRPMFAGVIRGECVDERLNITAYSRQQQRDIDRNAAREEIAARCGDASVGEALRREESRDRMEQSRLGLGDALAKRLRQTERELADANTKIVRLKRVSESNEAIADSLRRRLQEIQTKGVKEKRC